MFGNSVYVHSNMDNADSLTIDFSYFDHASDNTYNVLSTINKLNNIASDLDRMADEFLQGYSIEEAQNEADQAKELLVQLANRVLYGSSAYSMARVLTRNQTINTKKLKKDLNLESEIGKIILNYISDKSKVGISELTSYIIKTLSNGDTKITVTEAGSIINELGGLFNVDTIKRDGEEILLDNIFKTSRDLTTGNKGVFRKAIKDLIKTSKYGTVQNANQAITNFCKKLGQEMKKEAPNYVHYMWSSNSNKLNDVIDDFIERLKPELKQILNNSKILNISNTVGVIGEEVREAVSKTANSVIISLQVGDMTEDQIVNEMNKEIEKYGSKEKLSKMVSFHDDGKQSQTDLILLNTKTKAIARAQSKNHFATYFTQDKSGQDQINNFRWTVEKSVNLLTFVRKLSGLNLNTGLELNETDFNVVGSAIAHNLWAKNVGSHYVDKERGTIASNSVSVGDFQDELEGAMERLLAGQITSLLGVTLEPIAGKVQAIDSGSNIFYILNGRLKKTADLVREVINQINEYEFQTLSSSSINRSIIVTFTGMNLEGINTEGFLVNKLKVYPNSAEIQTVGTSMGEKILNQIDVTVSLGTHIGVLKRDSKLI